MSTERAISRNSRFSHDIVRELGAFGVHTKVILPGPIRTLFDVFRPFLKSNSRLQCPDMQAPPFPPLAFSVRRSPSFGTPSAGLRLLTRGRYSLLTQAFFQATGTRRKRALKTVLALRALRAPLLPSQGTDAGHPPSRSCEIMPKLGYLASVTS